MPHPQVRTDESARALRVRFRPLGLCPLLLVLAAGCYSYVAIPPETVPAGSQVRARLAGAPAMGSGAVFVGRLGLLEGEVVRRDDQALLLSVFSRTPGVQHWSSGPRDTVAIAWAELEALEAKRLSAGRTAGLVAGVGVASVLLVRFLFGEWSGGSPPRGPGGPAEVRLPG